MPKKLISIVIPTYNEKKNIYLLIRELLKIQNKNKLDGEIIIIDDDSPDQTGIYISELYKINRNIRVYIRKKQRGLSTAILYGIQKARGEIIIGMDADFNHHPKYIMKLLKILETADFVNASRFIEKGGMDDKFRYYGTYLFNLILRSVLSFPCTDNMSGYYAIRTCLLRKMPLEKMFRGYGEYYLRLVWEVKKRNSVIREIPVYYKRRRYGKSKSHIASLFFSYIHCALRLRFGRS